MNTSSLSLSRTLIFTSVDPSLSKKLEILLTWLALLVLNSILETGLLNKSLREAIFFILILLNLFSSFDKFLFIVIINELPSTKEFLFNYKISEKINNSNTDDRSVNLIIA